jgi:hypothetical protein
MKNIIKYFFKKDGALTPDDKQFLRMVLAVDIFRYAGSDGEVFPAVYNPWYSDAPITFLDAVVQAVGCIHPDFMEVKND